MVDPFVKILLANSLNQSSSVILEEVKIYVELSSKKMEVIIMSLHPLPIPVVPEQTAKIACSALPDRNLCLTLREELGTIFTDENLATLFPSRGQSAEFPWRLALITVLQFIENLSDRQAIQALRTRLDWKYLLSLELEDPGFDSSVLCEFRKRLLQNGQEKLLFEILLKELSGRGLLKVRGKQRTDSTHVLGAVRTLGRLECVGETLRHCLEVLATAVPSLLLKFAPAEWYARYTTRFEDFRLPAQRAERVALAEVIGRDGLRLLRAIYDRKQTEWEWLRHVQAVEILR